MSSTCFKNSKLHYHVHMPWQDLLQPEIQNFIITHQDDDVAALALKKPPENNWPYPLIIDQIKSRQKAIKKIPEWLDIPDIIFPASTVMEQASSIACALYKARLIKGQTFVDLTAGAGIDSYAFAHHFDFGTAVEMNDDYADILAHNFMVSGEDHIRIVSRSAEKYIKTLDDVDLAFIDPQRRNDKQRGIYNLSECSPNIFELLPTLKEKAQNVLIKTSPVLDIHKTIEALEHVHHVHIVQYNGECKEVLYHLKFTDSVVPDNVSITAVDINNRGHILKSFCFTPAQEQNAQVEYSVPEPDAYIYEPGPAFQKSGGFKAIATTLGVKKLHPNTHLYTSEKPIQNFPGRSFQLKNILNAQKKELQKHLPDMKASLSIRNFPMKIDDLRKKLGVRDGGTDTIIACILGDNDKKILHCVKLKSD